MSRVHRRLVSPICIAIGLASQAVLSAGQTTPLSDSARRETAPDFLRREVPRLMTQLEIPGAVVVLVQHDRVLMDQGFGVSDVERKTSVDSAATIFRIASVSKLFTAMAALDMVAHGKVTLTQDIRPLLPQLFARDRDDRPLTLHQLLTHTAGFDEQLIGYVNAPGVSAAGLSSYLSSSLPERTRFDANVPGYSNHGYGVVGSLVEQLAQRPFDRYVHDELFAKLGMTRTDFILQPTDSLPPGMSREYRSDGTRRIPRSTRAYPAGNVGTTGADMSIFLRWLLAALKDPDSTSSSARVAHQLVGPMLTYHPSLPPMGYGMSGVPMAGRVVWMKGGASPSHSAVVAVIPELDVALFIAVNRQEPLLWDRLIPSLVAKCWPDSAHAAVIDTIKARPGQNVSGTYRWTRAPLGSVERILGLAAQLTVSETAEGIAVQGAELSGRWRRTGGTTFQRASGSPMAFRTAADGQSTHLFSIIQGQPVSFERVQWFDNARVQLATFGASTVLGVVAAGAALRRDRRTLAPVSPTWARATVVTLPVVEFITIGAGVMLARQSELLTQGATTTLHVTLALTTATALAALAQGAGNVSLATRPNVSVTRRVVFSAGALGGVALASFLSANHLVRWSF